MEWFEARIYPVKDGVMVFTIDISDRIENLEKLQLENERFNNVTKATKDVIYEWDVKKDYLWWSEGICTTYGYQKVRTNHL